MAKRTIFVEGDPVLTKNCHPVTKFDDKLADLLEDMRLNPGRYIHFSAFGSRAAKRPYTPKEK